MILRVLFIHFAPLIILLLFPMHWLAKMDPDASIILVLEHPGPFLLASAYDFACFFLYLVFNFASTYHFASFSLMNSLQRL